MEVKQAAHVLELIEFFARHKRPATLAEIAKALGWPRSSTFNLLNTLTARGYLYEPRAREGYYPSPQWLWHLQAIERAAPLPEAFGNLLRDLSQQTGETACLAAISGTQVLFIDAVESAHAVRYAAPPGKVIPLHVTATGRALLSLLGPSERAQILRRATFERYTPTTLMSVEAVESEIQRSVQRGWFEGHAEFSADLGGVAIALAVPHRHLAVLVAGPVSRVGDRYPDLAQTMRRAAAHHLAGVLQTREHTALTATLPPT